MSDWGESRLMRTTLGGAGSFAQAKELYGRALEIRQKMASLYPANAALQLELTDTLFNIARLHEHPPFLSRPIGISSKISSMNSIRSLLLSEHPRVKITSGFIPPLAGDAHQ